MEFAEEGLPDRLEIGALRTLSHGQAGEQQQEEKSR
jgi:hypothetical protein